MSVAIDPAHDGWKPRTLPGFGGLVGPLWTRKEGEAWAYGLLAEERHTNPAALVHGGLICTLLDHALSAIAWEANARKPCITIALDVQFLAAARSGDFMVARGRITRQTASLAFLQGTLTVGESSVATASVIAKVV
jgi:uncharacterized protein (TIGR00369 family)